MFCNCLLGGGWKAMCFVSVWWWLESHVFCFCLVVAGKPYGMKKKNVVFVCCFLDQQKTAPRT